MKELHHSESYSEYGKLIKFGIVGGIGTIVNMAVLYALTISGIHYIAGSMIATEVAIIGNFIGNSLFTFRDHQSDRSLMQQFIRFQLISISTVIGTAALLTGFVYIIGDNTIQILIANAFAIGIMFIVNYILNRRITWNDSNTEPGEKHIQSRYTHKSEEGYQ